MAEQVDLTAVDQATPGTSTYRVDRLDLFWGDKTITIGLIGSNGERKTVYYHEADGAEALIVALNKVDLSTNSLQRRIMERLLADGHLTGSISGTPD